MEFTVQDTIRTINKSNNVSYFNLNNIYCFIIFDFKGIILLKYRCPIATYSIKIIRTCYVFIALNEKQNKKKQHNRISLRVDGDLLK